VHASLYSRGGDVLLINARVSNLALLAFVARLIPASEFTVARFGLLLNAAIGICVFHVLDPARALARKVMLGIVVAGLGGGVALG
jgi:glucose uptake protein